MEQGPSSMKRPIEDEQPGPLYEEREEDELEARSRAVGIDGEGDDETYPFIHLPVSQEI